MALINLTILEELSKETRLGKHLFDSSCFNYDPPKPDEAETYVALYKAYMQAQNLLNSLRRIQKVCTDFMSGNLEPYRTEWAKYQEGEEDVFDPFREIEKEFDSQTVQDLPQHISQYSELVTKAAAFVEAQKMKRQGFKKFFGQMPFFIAVKDEHGNTVMIPESELSEDIRSERNANRDIKEIEVEYSLDGYDTFYAQTRALIRQHREGGTVAECAESILSLIKT